MRPLRRGENVDHSGHRVGAVKRGKRTAHDFDALDAGGGEASPVVAGKVGIVDLDAVPQHQRLRRPGSAREERRGFAGRSRARQCKAGNFAQKVGDIERGLRVGVFLRDDADRRRRRLDSLRHLGRGDNDLLAELSLKEKRENDSGDRIHDDFPPKL